MADATRPSPERLTPERLRELIAYSLGNSSIDVGGQAAGREIAAALRRLLVLEERLALPSVKAKPFSIEIEDDDLDTIGDVS